MTTPLNERRKWSSLAAHQSYMRDLAVAASCLIFQACGDETYGVCIENAAKMPTEAGVRLARQQCVSKHGAALAAEAAEKTAAFLQAWSRLPELSTEAEIVAALDQPSLRKGPQSCSQQEPEKSCFRLYWRDPRQGRVCDGFVAKDCFFQLEIYSAGQQAGQLHVWWQDSF